MEGFKILNEQSEAEVTEQIETDFLKKAATAVTKQISKANEEEAYIEADWEEAKAEVARYQKSLDEVLENCGVLDAHAYAYDYPAESQEKKTIVDMFTALQGSVARMTEFVRYIRTAEDRGCIDCLNDNIAQIRVHMSGTNLDLKWQQQGIVEFITSVDPTILMKKTTITQELVDKDKTTCCVCFDGLELGDESALSCPGCQQCYDKQCIHKWLSDNNTCPSCRYKLKARFTIETSGRIYVNC